jgi:hypothetical protein
MSTRASLLNARVVMPTGERVDVSDGFPIDEPRVVVPWSVSEDELGVLLGPVLRHVTDKYWTARVQVLGGLACSLGFHFRGSRGQLSELEFFWVRLLQDDDRRCSRDQA